MQGAGLGFVIGLLLLGGLMGCLKTNVCMETENELVHVYKNPFTEVKQENNCGWIKKVD